MNSLQRKTCLHVSVWTGSAIIGISAVFYARLIAFAQAEYFRAFEAHSMLVAALSPLAFLGATALVRLGAPEAKGSGIPQVLQAIELAKNPETRAAAWQSEFISLRTGFIKILSSTLGIIGGASIGREGPTVQIASSAFTWVGRRTKKWVPGVDLHTYLVAGAAAGVAAAFNTPLAGITFALEEIAEGAFGSFKEMMMLSVIIGGVTAQALLGDYLYFGHPILGEIKLSVLPQALLIGTGAGLLGGVFAKLLSNPAITRLPGKWWLRALVCGVLCSLISVWTHGDTIGSGYEPTRRALEALNPDQVDGLFPFWKLITTVLSYLSGMAGGIFSPSLSIGAGVGITLAKLFHFVNFKACALIGMVAFFSAAVQAPFTAVIIVTEMTNEHALIIPFMIAAFLAHALGKAFMPKPLYRFLADRHTEA
ncbi:MAG: chloride channel protein [Methylotenera sp.]|nr:chloride channel protein [Oligoflexia bacterium]